MLSLERTSSIGWMALALLCACGTPQDTLTVDGGDPPDNIQDAGATHDAGTDPEVDAGTDPETDAGTDPEVDAGTEPNDNVVGPEGGTIVGDGVTLEIPAGALTEAVEITVEKAQQSAPQGVTALSDFFEFGPEGLTFATPATLSLQLASTPSAQARVYWSKAAGASGFDVLTTSVAGNVLSAEVSHFSVGFAGLPTPPVDETCGPADALTNTLLTGFAPIGARGPIAAPARIAFGGASSMYLLYGGGTGANDTRAYGATAWWSTDDRAFTSSDRSLFSQYSGAGRAFDASQDALYEFTDDGQDIAVMRRLAGGCASRVGTIARAYPGVGSAPLAVLPDGTIFAVVRFRDSPQVSQVMTSSDGGATWSERGEQPATLAAIAASNAGQIHVGRGYNPSTLGGVGTSFDGGDTWTTTVVPSGVHSSGTSTVQSLAVDPADASVVYAITNGTKGGLYVSNDAAATFPEPAVTIDGTPQTLLFTSDRTLWVTTSAGVFKRAHDATEWTAVNGDLQQEALAAWAIGLRGGELWRLGKKLWKSTDDGATWTEQRVAGFADLITHPLLTDPSDESTFYAAPHSLANGLYRTTDLGETFEPVTLPTHTGHARVAVVTGNGVLLAFEDNEVGGLGLRSVDKGETWQPMQGLSNTGDYGLSDLLGSFYEANVHVHRTGGTAYLVDNLGNLYRTDDDGQNWALVRQLGIEDGGLTHGVKLLVDPATEGRFFIVQHDGVNQALLVSTDAGATDTAVAMPEGLDVNWRDAQLDWDGRLWVVGNNPDTFEQKLVIVEPGTSTATAAPMPGGGFGSLIVMGRRASVGPSFGAATYTTDGGATWQTAPQMEPLLERMTSVFAHRANPERVFASVGTLHVGLLP